MSYFTPGLMSVTFRDKTIDDVVDVARRAGLGRISWSADVHVQPGDFAAAERARDLGERAGIAVEGYASYWRAGSDDFAPVIETALRLGAPRIRVWAGTTGSAETSDAERARIVSRLAQGADAAARAGITLHLEFHGNTLTDSHESTERLLAQIQAARTVPGHGVRTYWQPRPGIGAALAARELDRLAPHVDAVHVFSWDADGNRLPLDRHRDEWLQRLSLLRGHRAARAGGVELLLEFAAGDDADQLIKDAQTLHCLIGELEQAEQAEQAEPADQAAGGH